MSLKKEFTEEQIQRMRNLITGKYNSKVSNQVLNKSYSTKREEGDVWEEDGKIWTIQDGIRENIKPYDDLYTKLMMPLTCPCCGNVMNKKLDKVYYPIFEICFDCEVDKRDNLEREGKLEEYLKPKKNDFLDNTFEEFESFIRQKVSEGFTEAAENGDLREYEGGYDMDAIEQHIAEAKQYLEKQKE